MPLTSKPTSATLIITIDYILGRTLGINIRISHGLGVILVDLLAGRARDPRILSSGLHDAFSQDALLTVTGSIFRSGTFESGDWTKLNPFQASASFNPNL